MSVCESAKYTVITHDSVNFSPTKQKFSFAKNKRFSLPVADLKSKGDFNYDLPSTLRSRRASFGIGERFRNASSTRNRKLHSFCSGKRLIVL